MADKRLDTQQERSPSQERQEIPVINETGESSRPPQFIPPPDTAVPQVFGQRDDDPFKAQLLAAVTMFTQVMQNPRFMEFLQPSLSTQQVGQQTQAQESGTTPTQVLRSVESLDMPRQHVESMETPRSVPLVHSLAAEIPATQVMPVQSATFQQPLIGQHGQVGSFQALPQVFPPPTLHPGYFGGGSVFLSMAGYAPGSSVLQPGTVFGDAQTSIPNPMYGNIGMQPGFQGIHGSFGMPQGTFAMAGFPNQQVPIVHTSPLVSG